MSMKIGELLELTHKMSFNDAIKAAKENYGLSMGRDRTAKVLKMVGCYTQDGVRGWFLSDDADKSVLDASIHDFMPQNATPTATKRAENEAVATVFSRANVPASQLPNKTEYKEDEKSDQTENIKVNNQDGNKSNNNENNKTNNKVGNPIMKKVTYEIEEQLHDKLKIRAIVEKRTVSEIVNEIIKKGL